MKGGEKGARKGGQSSGVGGVVLSCFFALAAGGCKETGLCVVREHILYRELNPKPQEEDYFFVITIIYLKVQLLLKVVIVYYDNYCVLRLLPR